MREVPVLGSLREGETARVECVTSEGSMGRRLLDLGLTEGAWVTCVQKAPSGTRRPIGSGARWWPFERRTPTGW